MKDTVTLLPEIGRQFLPQGELLNSNVNFGLTLKVGRRHFSIKLQVVVSISVKKPYHKKNVSWLFQERGYWQFCQLLMGKVQLVISPLTLKEPWQTTLQHTALLIKGNLYLAIPTEAWYQWSYKSRMEYIKFVRSLGKNDVKNKKIH